MFNYASTEYYKEEEEKEINKYSKQAVDKKKELIEKHRSNVISRIKDIAKDNQDKGYVARFVEESYIEDYENDFGKETLIYVYMVGHLEEMDIDYYKQNAFKLMAKQNAAPKVDIDSLFIGFLDNDNKNIKVIVYEDEAAFRVEGYYTLSGKLVANSYEEVEEYIDNKYKEVEIQEEVEQDVNIYEEEQ